MEMEEEKQSTKLGQQPTEKQIAPIDDTSSVEEKIEDKIEEVEEAKEKETDEDIGETQVESEDLRDDEKE